MVKNEVDKAPKSAVNTFFKMGDKLTGGDPRRKADFDYYLLWTMFISFFAIFVSNLLTGVNLIKADQVWAAVKSFGWAFVIFAIIWFQYGALKATWQSRARIKSLPVLKEFKKEPIEEDSLKEMEAEFNDK